MSRPLGSAKNDGSPMPKGSSEGGSREVLSDGGDCFMVDEADARSEIDVESESCFLTCLFRCASLVTAALLLRALASSELLTLDSLWVRSCCFMLSFLVNALLQTGQWTPFSPVCFLP